MPQASVTRSDYGGSLCLAWSDAEEERYFSATITKATKRDGIFVLEADGHDPHDGRYSLEIHVEQTGGRWEGSGKYLIKRTKETIRARVCLVPDQAGSFLELTGTWHDEADSEPYEASVDLYLL